MTIRRNTNAGQSLSEEKLHLLIQKIQELHGLTAKYASQVEEISSDQDLKALLGVQAEARRAALKRLRFTHTPSPLQCRFG